MSSPRLTIRGLLREDSGQMLPMVAVMLIVLLAMTGFLCLPPSPRQGLITKPQGNDVLLGRGGK